MNRTGCICPQPLSLCGFPKANPRQRGTTGLLPDRCHWMGGTEFYISLRDSWISFSASKMHLWGVLKPVLGKGVGGPCSIDARFLIICRVFTAKFSPRVSYTPQIHVLHAGRKANELSPVLKVSILARSRRSDRFGEARMTQEPEVDKIASAEMDDEVYIFCTISLFSTVSIATLDLSPIASLPTTP